MLSKEGAGPLATGGAGPVAPFQNPPSAVRVSWIGEISKRWIDKTNGLLAPGGVGLTKPVV